MALFFIVQRVLFVIAFTMMIVEVILYLLAGMIWDNDRSFPPGFRQPMIAALVINIVFALLWLISVIFFYTIGAGW